MIEIKDKDDLRYFCVDIFNEVHREILFQKLSKFEIDADKYVVYFLEDCLEFSIKNLGSKKETDFIYLFKDFEVIEPIKVTNRVELFNLYFDEYLLKIDDETLSNFIEKFLSIVNEDNYLNINLGSVIRNVFILDKKFIDDNFTNGNAFESICGAIIESIKTQLNITE